MSRAGMVLVSCLCRTRRFGAQRRGCTTSAPATQMRLWPGGSVFLCPSGISDCFVFFSVWPSTATKGKDPRGNHTVCSLTPSFGAAKQRGQVEKRPDEDRRVPLLCKLGFGCPCLPLFLQHWNKTVPYANINILAELCSAQWLSQVCVGRTDLERESKAWWIIIFSSYIFSPLTAFFFLGTNSWCDFISWRERKGVR